MWSLIPWKKESAANGSLATEPWDRELSRIRNDFDSLLTRMWTNFPGFGDEWVGNWGAEMNETSSHYEVRVTAPGFETEDFDVAVQGNRLIVKAERKESQNGHNGSSLRYGHIQRAIVLPEGAKLDQVEARYHSGILEVKIPKGEESKAQRIEVKSY
jgi:HSP20 family protein